MLGYYHKVNDLTKSNKKLSYLFRGKMIFMLHDAKTLSNSEDD